LLQQGVADLVSLARPLLADAAFAQLLDVDHVVVCAGQEPVNALHAEPAAMGIEAALIGGAERAEEIDALRAIEQGMKTAYAL
jgi:2,4-dienoyl-CoA reductase (NADPH2)